MPHQPGRAALIATLSVLASAGGAPLPAQALDPFAFLRPAVSIDAGDVARADRGEVVVRMLPADGREVAVLGIASIRTEPDAFAAHIHDIAALKQSARVLGIRRFSNPPSRDDLQALELDPDELDALRRCRAGDCGLKLSSLEMARLIAAAGSAGPRWAPAMQEAFRDVVFDRVRTYLEGGVAALPPYQDKGTPVQPADVATRLLEQSPYLRDRLPSLVRFFEAFPRARLDNGDWFLYWSRERFDGKAVVSVTHVAVVRPDTPGLPLVVVAGRQILATHYTTGALSLTVLTGRDPRYLVYLNRSEVDVLGGFFGPLTRMILNRRLERDAEGILSGLRTRLEAPRERMP